ncbi:MAG: hypothetical protein ACLKAK_02155 [Alkaliphilus sp.]
MFRFISDYSSENEKLILVMDEFPYMVQWNSSIASILQNHWDHYFSDLNEKIGTKVLHQLKRKSENFEISPKDVICFLFSKSGFTDELIRPANQDQQVILVDYSRNEPLMICGLS